MALTYNEAQIKKMFEEKFGKVNAVVVPSRRAFRILIGSWTPILILPKFFAVDKAGEKIIVERIPPPPNTVFGNLNDIGGGALVPKMNISSASADEAEAPVFHKFGTVFVLMADQHQSIGAATFLDGTPYVIVLLSVEFLIRVC